MALGRGLGEILSEVEEAYEKDLSDIDSFELEKDGARIEELDIKTITPNPFQPRKHFDEQALKELSESIIRHGLLQPIVVIEKENGYLLIAGERRLRAHRLAKIKTIKAIVVDANIDDIKLRELALLENIQRENLNAIELANSYAELIEVHNITHNELSSIVNKSRSQITNTMRLLTLTPYVQNYLIGSKITQGHAKILVGLDKEKQRVVVNSIVGQKLSVRETENMVKKHKIEIKSTNPENTQEQLIKKYENDFHTYVPFNYKLKNKSIEIKLKNEEDINNFLAYFKEKK